jgi:hypothetical protein
VECEPRASLVRIMRISNQSALRRRLATGVVALMLTACSASVPSSAPPPTVAPTPVITPDPHLTDPATADAIFDVIRRAGLPLSVTNATGGDPSSPIVKQINAAIDNWPLVISQYKNSATLRAAVKWSPGKAPAADSPPYIFVGLNVLIAFGPTTGKPLAPDATRQAQAERLVQVIDPLLWPLEQRSVTPIPSRTAQAASPSAIPSKPSPKASPKPTVKP